MGEVEPIPTPSQLWAAAASAHNPISKAVSLLLVMRFEHFSSMSAFRAQTVLLQTHLERWKEYCETLYKDNTSDT